MNNNLQLIYVVVATFNGQSFIQEQLESIDRLISPPGTFIKILISDDGSSDETRRIIERYIQKHPNAELAVNSVSQQMGPIANFYFLLEEAFKRGADYVSLSDQDDIWLPYKIHRSYTKIKDIKFPAIYLGSAKIVDVNLQEIGRIPKLGIKSSLPSLLLSNQRAGMTFLMNREAVHILIKYKEIEVVMHDWWFELVLAAVGAEFFEDDNPYVLYRQHTSNVMGIANNYFKKIRNAFKRGSLLFELRSIQAIKIQDNGLLLDSDAAILVGNLIGPYSKSIRSLFAILMTQTFFSNRVGFQKLEARILLVISFTLYHLRKRTK